MSDPSLTAAFHRARERGAPRLLSGVLATIWWWWHRAATEYPPSDDK